MTGDLIALLADTDPEPALRPDPFPGCADAVLLHHLLHTGGTDGR